MDNQCISRNKIDTIKIVPWVGYCILGYKECDILVIVLMWIKNTLKILPVEVPRKFFPSGQAISRLILAGNFHNMNDNDM